MTRHKVMRKGQFFSVDVLIATVFFIIAITLFLVFVGSPSNKDNTDNLKKESENIPMVLSTSNMTEPGLGVVSDNKIDVIKLKELVTLNYTEMKDRFGVKNDFCIYFIDSEGHIIRLQELIGQVSPDEITGIGSPRAKVADIDCKTNISIS